MPVVGGQSPAWQGFNRFWQQYAAIKARVAAQEAEFQAQQNQARTNAAYKAATDFGGEVGRQIQYAAQYERVPTPDQEKELQQLDVAESKLEETFLRGSPENAYALHQISQRRQSILSNPKGRRKKAPTIDQVYQERALEVDPERGLFWDAEKGYYQVKPEKGAGAPQDVTDFMDGAIKWQQTNATVVPGAEGQAPTIKQMPLKDAAREYMDTAEYVNQRLGGGGQADTGTATGADGQPAPDYGDELLTETDQEALDIANRLNELEQAGQAGGEEHSQLLERLKNIAAGGY